MAGTVGAIFNGALQLGSAIGISAVGSIESSVEKTHGGPEAYAGRAAAFWFLLAIVGAEFISLAVFYRIGKEGTVENVEQKEKTLEEAESEEVVVEKGLRFADGQSASDMGKRDSETESPVDSEPHTTVSELPILKGDDNV